MNISIWDKSDIQTKKVRSHFDRKKQQLVVIIIKK